MIANLKKELRHFSNKEKAKIYANFFKTGKGQYGEGDVFLGLTVPQQRKIAKNYFNLPLKEIDVLLDSEIHEFRFTALVLLVEKYKKSKDKKYVDFYLKNANRINNWDLVDTTAPYILGDYLLNNKDERKVLYHLANSTNLWEKRIAIISTFAFIKVGEFSDTLKISEILLKDKHDLIHKAVGWMLREVGKKSLKEEEYFLNKYYKIMPRTMLRYAIEKFNDQKRKEYLKL